MLAEEAVTKGHVERRSPCALVADRQEGGDEVAVHLQTLVPPKLGGTEEEADHRAEKTGIESDKGCAHS